MPGQGDHGKEGNIMIARLEKYARLLAMILAVVVLWVMLALGINGLVSSVGQDAEPTPGPYWLTVVSCEDAEHQTEACIMYDESKWLWYPRGQIGNAEIVDAGRIKTREDALIDLNLGGLAP